MVDRNSWTYRPRATLDLSNLYYHVYRTGRRRLTHTARHCFHNHFGHCTPFCGQRYFVVVVGTFNLAPLSPPGGVFYGPGITAAAVGTFNPVNAGPGVHRFFILITVVLIRLITVAGVTAGLTLPVALQRPAFNLL